MLKLCGISRSSAILGSDSPQSNNRKDHSLWVTPFIPRERPNGKHAIAGYLRLPRPTSAPTLMRVLPLAIRPKIIARYEEAAVYGNGLTIELGLPNIGHEKRNNGRAGGHFEFDHVDFFQDASSPESRILFYSRSNGPAI